MNMYEIIRKISTNRKECLQNRSLLILCFFLTLTGCANNSYVRTQRILNKGDIVMSGSANIPMPIPFVEVGQEVGSSSPRVESSLLLGSGWGEIGLFGALVPLPDVIVPIGQQLRFYLGRKFKVEFFRETFYARDDFHRSMIGRITTVTDGFLNNYRGIHFIHAYSESNGYNNYYMNVHERIMKGFGYTQGFEKNNTQIQGDLSFIFTKESTGYDTGIIIRLSGGYNFLRPLKLFKHGLGPSSLPEKESISFSFTNEERLDDQVINYGNVMDSLNGIVDRYGTDTKKNDKGNGDAFVLVGGDEIRGDIINEDHNSITISSPQLGTLLIKKDRIDSLPVRMEKFSIADKTKNSPASEIKVIKAKPDEIRSVQEKENYSSLLIKKIKRIYLISCFQSIGAIVILNIFFETFN